MSAIGVLLIYNVHVVKALIVGAFMPVFDHSLGIVKRMMWALSQLLASLNVYD